MSKEVFISYRIISLIFGFVALGAMVWGLGEAALFARASYDDIRQDTRDRVLGVGDFAPIEVNYKLLSGWNLVSFPVEMREISTAVGLMIDVAVKGGYISTVSYWDGDRWIEVSQRKGVVFGHDFDLVPGRAYFLRNHIPVDWSIQGTPVPSRYLEVELSEGWNAVGWGVSEMLVEEVIDGINRGRELAIEVNRWDSGLWDPFVKRIYSKQDIQTYGNNFMTELNRGYMLRVNRDMKLRVGDIAK